LIVFPKTGKTAADPMRIVLQIPGEYRKSGDGESPGTGSEVAISAVLHKATADVRGLVA
jgi:hypothetical protein